MDNRREQFVRGLYFDMQTVEGVKPLEIWNGVREKHVPQELAYLAKNLLKIVIPLVNEECSGKAFSLHSQRVRLALAALISWLSVDPEKRLFQRFPYPPTGDGEQKELYGMVREAARDRLAEIGPQGSVKEGQTGVAHVSSQGMLPDGLFDFREMRIVDNELPFIIFTEKEFRVIHGLAIVYMWLIDIDSIFLDTMAQFGGNPELIDVYRQFARRVQSESPLAIKGKSVDAKALANLIQEKLQYGNYLDLFENVDRWFEQTRERFTTLGKAPP
jgi:hypothetical protein